MGGPFIIIIGLCIMAGALFPDAKSSLVNIGFIVGGMTFTYSWKLAQQLPHMTRTQIASVIIAILAEVIVFYEATDTLKSLGERRYLISVLALVAAHFFIMSPAYGLAAVALAIVGSVNAAIAWVEPRYATEAIWFVDGALKALIGVTMVLSSPALYCSQRGRSPDFLRD